MSAPEIWYASVTILSLALFISLISIALTVASLCLWTRYAYALNLAYIASALLCCASFVFLCGTVVLLLLKPSVDGHG